MSTLSTTVSGLYQNQITDLPTLGDLRFETIFKVYKTDLNHYFYNILNSISLPKHLDPNSYYLIPFNHRAPWTSISYSQYGTTDLWWLICLVNQISNPIKISINLTQLKIIKPDYVRTIITEIQGQLQ